MVNQILKKHARRLQSNDEFVRVEIDCEKKQKLQISGQGILKGQICILIQYINKTGVYKKRKSGHE